MAAAGIAQFETPYLYRLLRVYRDRETLGESAAVMLVNRISLPVADAIRQLVANRKGRGRPDSSRLFVANLDHFRVRIAERFVGIG